VTVVLTELEVRCTECRGGLVCADEWQAWYARADEVEAAFVAEHGSVSGLESSDEWQLLVDERPTSSEEVECADCGGTGIALTETGHAVLAWARQRMDNPAA
jgi:hypothetical protein